MDKLSQRSMEMTSTPPSVAVLGCALLCCVLSACNAYDGRRLNNQTGGGDRDAGGNPNRDAGDSTCSRRDPVTCAATCTETCNGMDDDCDDVIDEGNDRVLCGQPIGNVSCSDGECVTDACVDGLDSDSDGQRDCEDGCPFDATTTARCLRKQITISAGKATEDLTDFPVLVRLVDPALSAARPDGFDLWFSVDGGQTALPFEIERFVKSTGEFTAWVKLPLIATASDTTFYLRYGDGSGTDKSNAASVWTNGFRAVYHMGYGGGAGTQNDSSGNANHATPDTGGGCDATESAPADQTAGVIGRALTFGANACNRLLANDSDSLDVTTELTVSAWLRVTGTSVAGPVVSKRVRTNETCNYQMQLWTDGNMGTLWGNGTMWPPVYNSAPAATPATDAWAYAVWTIQGSPLAMRTYLDGARINSADQNRSSDVGGLYPTGRQLELNANTHGLFIGGVDQETDNAFKGDLDEVRIAAASRPVAWIKAEYDNQQPASTFLTIVED